MSELPWPSSSGSSMSEAITLFSRHGDVMRREQSALKPSQRLFRSTIVWLHELTGILRMLTRRGPFAAVLRSAGVSMKRCLV